MTISYNLGIPDAPNNPSVDQPKMKANNDAIAQYVAVDHIDFGVAHSGVHKQVQMPLRGGGTGTIPPGLFAGEGTLYTKTGGTDTQLFYSPDASGNEYQMTRAITASFTATFGQFAVDGAPPAGTISTFGWTFLPGGLMLQYGTITGLGVSNLPASRTVNFPVAFTNTPYSINITVRRDNAADADSSISRTVPPTTTGFTYVIDSSTADALYWQAIGL